MQPEEASKNEIVPQEQPELPVKLAELMSSGVVDSAGFLTRSNCKLCNFHLRKEAEEMYESTRNASEVHRWLVDNGLAVAVQNVRHHMREHYKSSERMLALQEYVEDLSGMMAKRRSRREELELLVAVSKKEIARVASLPTDGAFSKEKDRNSMILNAAKTMKDAIASINAMEDAEAKTAAVKHRFIQTWKDLVANAPDEKTRNVYIQALRKFQKADEEA